MNLLNNNLYWKDIAKPCRNGYSNSYFRGVIMNNKFSKSFKIKLGIFALLNMILLITTACSSEKKVSSLILNAVENADQAVKPTVEDGHKATAEEIEKIRTAEALVKEVADTYKLVTRAENAGPFEDMANALGARAEYLETGNQQAYDTFNSLYGKSKAELLKFSQKLKEKGL